MAKDDMDRIQRGILGDIDPETTGSGKKDDPGGERSDVEESMVGGSRHDRTEHSGSRDVTEGTTTGTEVGGTRNYRQGSGATGTDIGNGPE
jgi:hypothetical protein